MMARRSAKYPRYSTNISAVEVRRGSHSHQVPQVVWPQTEPVTSVRAVNKTPISAEEAANVAMAATAPAWSVWPVLR